MAARKSWQRILRGFLLFIFITCALNAKRIPDNPARAAAIINNPGQISLNADRLFANDRYNGIYLYSLTNITSPVRTAFLAIDNNVAFAVKNNWLYANGNGDLQVFDVSDPANPQLIKSLSNVFPAYATVYRKSSPTISRATSSSDTTADNTDEAGGCDCSDDPVSAQTSTDSSSSSSESSTSTASSDDYSDDYEEAGGCACSDEEESGTDNYSSYSSSESSSSSSSSFSSADSSSSSSDDYEEAGGCACSDEEEAEEIEETGTSDTETASTDDEGSSFLWCTCDTETSPDDSITQISNETALPRIPARLAVLDNYLYCSSSNIIRVFSISNPAAPLQVNSLNTGADIYRLKSISSNLLLAGSDTGTRVYSLDNPESPQYQHSLDSVSSNASLTVISNRLCAAQEDSGRLYTWALTNTGAAPPAPYSQSTPLALAARSNYCFVAAGSNGMSVLHMDTAGELHKVSSDTTYTVWNIAMQSNILIVDTWDTFHIYDVNNPSNFQSLSVIE